jgi:hypothetical protein
MRTINIVPAVAYHKRRKLADDKIRYLLEAGLDESGTWDGTNTLNIFRTALRKTMTGACGLQSKTSSTRTRIAIRKLRNPSRRA